MPSDAFIGVLTGLGEAHRARQKNIFDQEVARRSKYEQFLQKASTDPTYRPEAQDQFSQLYSTLIMTPPEKKLPKDFERQVTDALTSVEGSMDLRQGGPPEQASTPGPIPQSQPIQPPEPFQGKMASRISPQEVAAQKIRESVQMLQALGPIQMQQALEQKRGELALEPPRVGSFPPESGIWEQDPVTRRTTVIREPELKPVKPPTLNAPRFENKLVEGYSGPQEVFRITDPDSADFTKEYITGPGGQRIDVTGKTRVYEKPVQPPYVVRVEGAIGNAAQELPKEWRNVVTRAIPRNTPAQARLATIQEASDYLASGDTEGLKSRIRQLAIEGENVSTQAQVEGRADAMNAMREAVDLMGEMQREGIPTNILSGTWEDIMRKLGTTSHPKRVEFNSRMQRALSAYTLAMSGVQFSENEAKRYLQLFPNYSNTMPVNAALTNSLLKAMETEDRRFWTQKLGPDGAKLVGAVGTTPPPSVGGAGMIRVQIPGQPPGQIPQAALQQFLRDNPGAKQLP